MVSELPVRSESHRRWVCGYQSDKRRRVSFRARTGSVDFKPIFIEKAFHLRVGYVRLILHVPSKRRGVSKLDHGSKSVTIRHKR